MQLDNVEDFYPLTPLQEGLLFHSLSEPRERGLYFNQALLTLTGELDVPAFRRAWERVLQRHAILRTFFAWEGVKEPVQVVQRTVELPFAFHDLRRLSGEVQQQQIEAIRRDDLEQGFDLSQAPLLRVILLQTADDSHEFLWSFHHILMDGWSMFAV
ncbi:MAG: condensation domain-containing protein, partial [bacterium]